MTQAQSLSQSLSETDDQNARAMWHHQVGVGYQTLAESTQNLSSSAVHFCQAPNNQSRLRLELHWQQAFLDWQTVRFIDFGPIDIDSRAWQLQFWPDPKNLVGTKARQLLATDAPIDQEEVSAFGVAAKGFPMLEYLLFDATFNQTEQALPYTRACELLVATANIVEENTSQLSDEWSAMGEHYRKTDTYTATTVRSAMTALDILVHKRLGEPMGLGSTQRRLVYAGDAWRSGQSLAAVEATIAGMQNHFLPGLVHELQQADQREMANKLNAQWQATLERFEALPDDLASVLEDDQSFARLQGLYVSAQQLEQILSQQAAVALGIRQGFNSSDGD